MLIPPNGAPRNLHPLPDGIVDRLVRYNDIPSLGERRDYTGYCRERLRIDDARRGAQECRNVSLDLHMHVLGAIKPGRAAWPNPISPHGLNRPFFQILVGDEIVEIVGGEIRHGSSIGQLGTGTAWTVGNEGSACIRDTAAGKRVAYPTMTGLFSNSASSNAVVFVTRDSGVHSSTRSSISYIHQHEPAMAFEQEHRLHPLHPTA